MTMSHATQIMLFKDKVQIVEKIWLVVSCEKFDIKLFFTALKKLAAKISSYEKLCFKDVFSKTRLYFLNLQDQNPSFVTPSQWILICLSRENCLKHKA